MAYNVENLRKLRSLSEVGIKECIKALDVNNNDLSKALQWLKERSSSFSKSSRFEPGGKLNKFGLVRISSARNRIIAFSLKCESDFVAMNGVFAKLADDITVLLMERFAYFANCSQEKVNEELASLVNSASYSLNEKIYTEKISFFSKEESEVFGQYIHHNAKVGAFVVLDKGSEKVARELSMQAVANSPVFLTVEDIPSQVVSAQLERIRQLVIEEMPGKEALVIKKVIDGRFSKWTSEVCFLEQNDFRDPGRKVKQILHNAGTNIKYLFLTNIDN